MAEIAVAPAGDAGSKRPEQPDEAKFKLDLAAAEKAHKAAQAEFVAAKSKLDGSRPGKGSAGDRWSVLVDDQKDIRTKQSAHKSSRTTQQSKFDANDKEIKALIQQQKDAKARIGFNSSKEVEEKISGLMKGVDSGKLSLVQEKKDLNEASNLRRQLKSFGALDDIQAKIDAKKAENTELKKTFDNAETKALSEKYEANQKELDQIKASRDDVNKNFDKLKAEKEQLNEKQQGTWKVIQDTKDKYYASKKAYKEFQDKQYQQQRERKQAEYAANQKEKRKRVAEQRLEDASALAFSDEILTAEGIIRHFDPAYGAAEDDKGPGKFAATNQRSVDESGFKGMTVMKKDEEDFFVGAGSKKKGKKGPKPASDSKFNLSIDIIEGLGKLGLNAPSNQSEVPGTVEKLKVKVADWKKHQKAQTDKNIEKAKHDIEKLEQEAEAEASAPAPKRAPRQDRSKKVAQKDAGIDDEAREVNVDAEAVQADEKDGVADAAKDLKAANLEDAENDEVATG